VLVLSGEELAEKFKSEELDGVALGFMTDLHLMQTMQIKLGPALKIMGNFTHLRKDYINKN
jgi:hypothetical protein